MTTMTTGTTGTTMTTMTGDAMHDPAASETPLLVVQTGRVRRLTLNRPDKRNALNFALTQALVQALAEADADDGVGCILLSGAGRGFCAGADLSEFKTLTPANQPLVEQRAQLTMQLHRGFPQLRKPVVAAVNGAAMGGGAGIALACDLVLMAESATLGFPEVRHGIVAAIVMANLVRQLGRKAAFELVALGQPIGASEALRLGMINRVCADDQLLPQAEAMAAELAAMPPQAMTATKQLFHEVADLALAPALERGRAMNARMRGFARPQG